MNRILWHSPTLGSSEHLRLDRSAGGHRLSGTVVLPVDARPAQIRYTVDVDEDWRSVAADAAVDGSALQRRFLVEADGDGSWRVDGEPMPELDGCIDIDLGFTPSTNTLPIRRLGLGVGEQAQLRAAWIKFPELSVLASEQSYERLDESIWRYASGGFSADLEVDPSSGLVLRYGDIWTALAGD